MKILDTVPLITIIIPVYNSEQWLKKCLDSVIMQTYKRFECIILDDGSTDGCGCIMDSYAEKDIRLKVIHKVNEGISVTRNRGIKEAKGDWIVILDSDDWFEPDYIEGFLSADAKSELVIQSIEDYLSDNPICNIQYHFPDKLWDRDAIAQLYSDEKMMKYGTTWSRLYKREIIEKNHLLFNPQYSSKEDVLFAHQYLSQCKAVSTVSYYGYHYIYHSSSLAHTIGKHMSAEKLKNVTTDIYMACRSNQYFMRNRTTTRLINEIFAFSMVSSIRMACCSQNLSHQEKVSFIRAVKQMLSKHGADSCLLRKPKCFLYFLPSNVILIINKLL